MRDTSLPERSEARVIPSEADAALILERVTGPRPAWLARFSRGLARFVYDAELVDGRRYAVRLARLGQSDSLAGAWLSLLVVLAWGVLAYGLLLWRLPRRAVGVFHVKHRAARGG